MYSQKKEKWMCFLWINLYCILLFFVWWVVNQSCCLQFVFVKKFSLFWKNRYLIKCMRCLTERLCHEIQCFQLLFLQLLRKKCSVSTCHPWYAPWSLYLMPLFYLVWSSYDIRKHFSEIFHILSIFYVFFPISENRPCFPVSLWI